MELSPQSYLNTNSKYPQAFVLNLELVIICKKLHIVLKCPLGILICILFTSSQ